LGLVFAELRTTALVAWQAERPMETELFTQVGCINRYLRSMAAG
jgi:hypothetical protein